MNRIEMKTIQTNRVPTGLETESIYNLGNILQIVDECYDEFEPNLCENCQYYVESKVSQQFGHCLRTSEEPSLYNGVMNDWYCKGIEDEIS